MYKQLTLSDIGLVEKSWQYDEDNGTVMCRCPECEGRMIIHRYQYINPYHYCPYCGIKLAEGRLINKRCEVYGSTREEELKVRADIEQLRKKWRI